MKIHTGKSFRQVSVWRLAKRVSALKVNTMAFAVLVLAGTIFAQQSSSAYASTLISNRSDDMSIHTATQKRQIRMLVGEKSFSITLADTRAVRKLMQLLPLTLRLHDYGGFEKVGALGTRLPSDDVWMTARTGDVVLYNSNQIVLMCGSNSWNYTRLGHVSDSGDWIKTLGDKDVEIQLIAR